MVLAAVVYAGIVIPGWIIAARYEPPPPLDPPQELATSEVTLGRLMDEWSADGTPEWSTTVTVVVPGPATMVEVAVGDRVRAGDSLYSGASGTATIVQCAAAPRSVGPGENGGPFLGCVQDLLIDLGYSIDAGERESATFGRTSRAALAAELRSRDAEISMTDANLEERVAEARFALRAAQLERDALPFGVRQVDLDRADLAVEQRTAQLRRLRTHHGVILDGDDWVSLPLGEGVVTAVLGDASAGRSIVIGAGDIRVVAFLPPPVQSATDRQWTISVDGERSAASEVAIRDAPNDPVTGAPRVEVVLAAADPSLAVPPDQTVPVSLVANDTVEEVVSVPGGALFGSPDDGYVEVRSNDGIWNRIDIDDGRFVSGRLVLPDTDIAVGAVVRLR